VFSTDGDWFVATEGFDVALATKLRNAMLATAKQTPAAAAKAASAN
jgi:hypothetical protein